MEQEQLIKILDLVNANTDSLEIGTPSKGGAIKIYGNYGDKEAFKKKIDDALECRRYANEKMGEVKQ